MADVTLKDIRKSFGALEVIKGIDLDIRSGEFVVFVGPSGCGKSTLLRIVAGLEESTAGELTIGGKDVTYAEPADRGIAMVFQSYALYPHMTVAENIGFGLSLARRPKAEIEAKVRAAPKPATDPSARAQAEGTCPVASASAWRSAVPSCATRKCSCSMNRCPISTLHCARRCAWRSPNCMRD
jgi:ABC-type sugar transport system ATPase subunit